MNRPTVLVRKDSVDLQVESSANANISTSRQFSIQDGEFELSGSLTGVLSSRVESRRKYALAVAILDAIVGMGQLVYHINRAVNFFDHSAEHMGQYDHLSWASYVLWTITFLFSTLQICMAILLITACYSQSTMELSRMKIRKSGLWIMTSQLIMTILIIKVIIFTASSQLDFDLGVFYVLLENSDGSIWFVLIFYSLQIVFRGFAIYLVKKYIQYLE